MAVKRLQSGTYQADWRDESGVRQRKSFPNKALAEYFLSQQKFFDSSEGKARQALSFKQMTVAELADKYVEKHLKFTRAGNNSSYFEIIKARWGTQKLFRVSSSEVRQWILEFIHCTEQENKYALSSIKKILSYFKRLFNWAIEEEIITHNPIKGVSFKKEFKRINRRSKVLESDQFWELIEKLPNDPEYLKQVAITAWCTGMRVGEIINLTWAMVDTVNWVFRLRADQTKETDIKTIGIESELKKILLQLKGKNECKKEDYVFQSSVNKQIDPNCLDRVFRKHTDRAGFVDIRLHDLRHCYTRRKRREGFDRSVIKAQTGHHTDSMFDWYDKVDEDEIIAMSGNSCEGETFISEKAIDLVEISKEKGISLGVVQGFIGRLWRAKAA